MRILGIDYGEARIGVAVSDALGIIANALDTIHERDYDKKLQRVRALAEEYGVKTLVVGDPKRMDNSAGQRAEATREFARRLGELCGAQTVLWDERLTSAQAHRLLEAGGVSGKKRKGKVDAMAAAIILQSYLDSNAKGGAGYV